MGSSALVESVFEPKRHGMDLIEDRTCWCGPGATYGGINVSCPMLFPDAILVETDSAADGAC